jgi:hypothetical protein
MTLRVNKRWGGQNIQSFSFVASLQGVVFSRIGARLSSIYIYAPFKDTKLAF